MGRREANKAHTREALVDAVYEILLRDGEDGLTTEKIADAANVSRRTFFNYFPSVDAAIAAPAQEAQEELARALLDRPEDEPLLESAKKVVEAVFTRERLADAAVTWAACDRSPSARKYVLDQTELLAGLAGGWVLTNQQTRQSGADELTVAVMTASTLAAYDAARLQWLAENPGPVDDVSHDRFIAQVHTAIEMLRPAVEAAFAPAREA